LLFSGDLLISSPAEQMEDEIGIACGRCDWYSAMKTTACPSCGNDLALFPPEAPKSAKQDAFRPGTGKKAPTAAEASSSAPTISAREEDAEPTSSMFDDPLKPRRISSGKLKLDLPSSGRIRATNKAGQDLGRTNEQVSAGRAGTQAASMSASGLSLEELMDQAKNFVCKSCSTAVPMGHKFCGRCGAAVPPEILNSRTQFLGQLQVPGKAKLILIRGEGVEGLSYQLNAEQHVVGRNGQLVFPDDPFVSPKHANLFYRSGKLVVRDEGSLNGVYLRVRGTVDIASGDCFLAGEQLFRLDATPKLNDGPAPDGTYFYSSPKHQSSFRLVQLLQGGAEGMIVCARSNGLQIGREGGDLNFPTDLYMSASHCKIEESGGKLTLTDLNSRNGTYVKISAERELAHGDYLFIGRKLLRVEITAA
jgi:pSer/pThr/pTyr-binding forkhead associated (FHA) protein